MNRLPPPVRWLRLGLAAGLLLVPVLLALQKTPRHLSPLPCGFHAVTGLPCLFCGGTRAVRAILHWNYQSAVYLNVLAFPALAVAALAVLILLSEAATGRALAPWGASFHHLNRLAPALIIVAVVWWIFHVWSALKTPKPELVNFRNPVAAEAGKLLGAPACK